jgi:hypothetical protein
MVRPGFAVPASRERHPRLPGGGMTEGQIHTQYSSLPNAAVTAAPVRSGSRPRGVSPPRAVAGLRLKFDENLRTRPGSLQPSSVTTSTA